MYDTDRPLAVTMGDPSGIGPEIVAALAAQRGAVGGLVVVGDPAVMERAVAVAKVDLRVKAIDDLADPSPRPRDLPVLRTGSLPSPPAMGRVSAESGRAAYDAVIAAIDLAKSGAAAGVVTAPINKEALAAAGIRHPGHTEILAERGGAERVAMMLANDEIRTVLVSIHCSLAEAIRRADMDGQMAAIRMAHEGCRALGIDRPRVAVAGLNPHAGEGGLFGTEEIDTIAPAIARAREEGIDATGPWPGDTVFMAARTGRFDVVVAQYHDQGLIPVKYMGLDKGVNVTLGLPFVRTSPDHGTAFDIAGQGIADPASMIAAFDYAVRLAGTRQREAA